MPGPIFGTPQQSSFSLYARHLDQFALPEPSRQPLTIDIPYDLLGVFIRSYEEGRGLPRIPVYALAEIGLSDRPPDVHVARGTLDFRLQYPLGLLGTDHIDTRPSTSPCSAAVRCVTR